MVSDVVAAVSAALHAVFGDGCRCYQDPVPQGAQTPCFFLGILEPRVKPLLGARSRLEVPMDLHYFPEQDGSHRELTETAGRLPAALEVVELPGGPVRGREMSWRIEDGVLHFFVTYTVFQEKVEEKTDMGALAVETSV